MNVVLYFLAGCGAFACCVMAIGVVIIVADLRRGKREHRALYAEWQTKAVAEAGRIIRSRR